MISGDSLAILALWVPLLVALIAAAGAYLNATLLERRKAALAQINEQLEKLYGPLFALSRASEETWLRFRQHNRPDMPFFDAHSPPTEAELEMWRRWLSKVFIPLNERMAKVIVEHMHLLEGSTMPSSFLTLIANVEAFRVIKSRWAEGDLSEHAPTFNFPADFRPDVEAAFHRLRARQAALIGATQARAAD